MNPIDRTDPSLIAVARGDADADLVLRNARIVDVFTRTIQRSDVAVFGGRIAGVGRYERAARVEDLGGRFVAPGLIDAHMHLESTMLLPDQFVRVTTPRGTTGAVLDPHEIANVLGVEGIRLLMDLARDVPMRLMFGVSSCVPASPLETAGAELTTEQIIELLDDPRVVCLAEMMNFPGVVRAVPGVLERVRAGLARRVVDGHCPQLRGPALNAYISSGVSSDHECTTPDEALEKVRRGMRVYIRQGSAAQNLEALLPAVTPENAHRFCFCTDDRHPHDLMHEGHIDHVVRSAIALGLDPATAIAMGSLHTADHYRRPDLGAIAPGRLADLAVYDDLHELRAQRVYVGGALTAEDGTYTGPDLPRPSVPARMQSTVRLADSVNLDALRVSATSDPARVRVIRMSPTSLITESSVETLPVRDGMVLPDPSRDLLKLAVFERHRGTGNVGVGFVHGFGLARGALASTVGHDSHNIISVGVNDASILAAARALEAAGGGQCAVDGASVLALMPLPLAGLMSLATADELVHQQAALLRAAHSLGTSIPDPFMPLSFLPLTVIPHLKLSDRGLVDVDAFDFTPLVPPRGSV